MKDTPEKQNETVIGDTMLAPDQQLCFAIYSAAHAFTRTYKPMLERFGLTYPQYLVLLSLWQTDGMTVKAIGEELGLDSGTLSPLLKRLETAGHISRTRDRQDERQVIVRLTPSGKSLKKEAFGILIQIGAATGCTQQEAADLRDLLHRLTHRLDSPPKTT